MSSFSPRVAGSSVSAPDPTKHVNYSLGMVLGVDDFTQEFAYLSGRDQWTARDLLGYGTVDGLAVSVAYDTDGRGEVVVTPGVALSPRGQLIRVTPTQCASLGDWLAQERNRERLSKLPTNTTVLPLYVVLSYRECATDDVPIPGEPCRSEEDSMEASRLADNFRLELSPDPPAPGGEEAVRDFVQWLAQAVVVGDESGGTFATLEQFEAAVRQAAGAQSPPASPPDYMYGSPPGSLRVAASDACEFLRAAFRLWVTELRPLWGGAGSGPGVAPNEEGVLLAELSVPVRQALGGGAWELQHPGVAKATVGEGRRPFVLHLRMLQEWIECGRAIPTPGDYVTPGTSYGQTPSPGVSPSYSRDDHDHGTPNPLSGDVTGDADGHTVVGAIGGIPVVPSSDAPPFPDQVLLYKGDQWVAADAPALAMTGDVEGSTDDNEIVALKGVPFVYNEASARQGQVLTYVLVETGEESLGGVEEATPNLIDTRSARTISGETIEFAGSPPSSPPSSPPASPKLKPVWVPADLTIQGEGVQQPDAENTPQDGQVLTFYSPGGGVAGNWRAMQLPDVTLRGDAQGPAESNRVAKIQGSAVADFTQVKPQNGEILTYAVPSGQTEGSWTSKPPANLAGDVTGPRDQTTVQRLHGTDIIDFSAAGNGPQNGQVLTWVGPGTTTPGRWQASTPAASNVTLGGDVTGGAAATTVARLRGTPIADFNAAGEQPADGSVLVYRLTGSPPAGGWHARINGGDVVGPPTDSTVSRIRRFPISVRSDLKPFENGDVLVFKDGFWTPQAQGGGTTTTGSFVERPAGQPAYSIVAAGILPKRTPLFGGLTLAGVRDGFITVNFEGYKPPDGTFQYVVKVLPVVPNELDSLYGVVVTFSAFLETGFDLRVTNQGRSLTATDIGRLEFMIEVSRFEAGR